VRSPEKDDATEQQTSSLFRELLRDGRGSDKPCRTREVPDSKR